MKLEETQLSRKTIYDGKVLRVVCDEVLLPDGVQSVREFCIHVGAVCVVPVTDEGEIVCVKQYRYAIGRVMLEIPAGKLDFVGEDPVSAAKRELREETGATCRSLRFIGKYLGSPALLNENIWMYLAEGLEFGDTDLDDDEFLSVERIPVDELVERICSGEIEDGKTQAAVLKAALIINKEKGE